MSLAAVVEPLHERSSIRGRTIVGASVAGASHVGRGVPCQDAFCVFERRDAFAIAVADGLGSAARSDLGADIATVAAAARALQFADDDPSTAAIEAMLAARDALEVCAQARSIELRDLGCTLLVAAGTAERIGVAHVGDGAVVGRAADGWHVLSPPAPSEYLNETDPITAQDWERRVRCVSVLPGVDALAMFTDGCQHAGLRHDGHLLRAHDAFFRPLADYVSSGVEELDATFALRKLLAGRKLGEHSDDDKTLVLAVL
jgi:hypothetical protein